MTATRAASPPRVPEPVADKRADLRPQRREGFTFAHPDRFSPATWGRRRFTHAVQRLFYALTGPDQDGVATEAFDVPLPIGTDVSAFVLTANLGSEPRNCEGVAFKVQANPGDDSPPVAKSRTSPPQSPSRQPHLRCTSWLPLVSRGGGIRWTWRGSRLPASPSPRHRLRPRPRRPQQPRNHAPTMHVVTLLGDVGFDRDRAVLTSSGRATISLLATHLRGKPVVGTVTVEGYTDNLGTAAHGQHLSEQRAAAVADMMRAKLRARHFKIVSRGFGEHHAIASNRTEAGRRQNRRVEIVFSLSPT